MDRVASEYKPSLRILVVVRFFLFPIRDKQTLERQSPKGDEQERVGENKRGGACVLFAN
jgi:hypothetical protein